MNNADTAGTRGKTSADAERRNDGADGDGGLRAIYRQPPAATETAQSRHFNTTRHVGKRGAMRTFQSQKTDTQKILWYFPF
ncbi:hypothetical protein FEMY_20380 [Ferrovum myxofaciens]|uniref:Uncharacterized protein n=1 Tax=Ferrovum myxofaciens TaxID=416213 RepID=A0A149VW86_9PROT|nr:hypothetical protein FEMY_20380 [Ferrovum myxofaciens]